MNDDFFEYKNKVGAEIVRETLAGHALKDRQRNLRFINECRDILGERHMTEEEYNANSNA